MSLKFNSNSYHSIKLPIIKFKSLKYVLEYLKVYPILEKLNIKTMLVQKNI